MQFPKFIIPVLFAMILVSVSCTVDEEIPEVLDRRIKEAIYTTMTEWYYWNDRIPTGVNVDHFPSNENLLNSLIFRELDQWSYITTPDAFNRAFTGQQAGHGFGFALGDEERIFVSFVYENSPAGKDGWQRGWEILGINGRPISYYRVTNGFNFQLGPNTPDVSNTFSIRLPNGTEVTKTLGKADYQLNSVLYKEVLDIESQKIGYWVYNSFRATSGAQNNESNEVNDVLSFFEEQDVKQLIIDLRYNGGGSVDVAEQVMNALIPSRHDGKLMYTNALNSAKSNFNESYNFNKTGNLELDRLIFITSRNSASASELIINCLSPYIEIVTIGENTYGKPVGSFPLSNFNTTLSANNVELVPVTFSIANALGNADYFGGLPADFLAGDDPSKNWGDPEDPRLGAALNYIRYGSVGPSARLSYKEKRWAMIDNFTGLQKEFPVY